MHVFQDGVGRDRGGSAGFIGQLEADVHYLYLRGLFAHHPLVEGLVALVLQYVVYGQLLLFYSPLVVVPEAELSHLLVLLPLVEDESGNS